MTDKEQEARDLADTAGEQTKQAGSQAKAAVKNAARAAKAAAEPVAEAVVDETRDTVHKLEGTAHDAAEAAKRVDPNVIGKISSDTGIGFLALSVSIYSGVIAFAKFRQAASGRSHVIS